MAVALVRTALVVCATALLGAQDAQETRLRADLEFLTSDVLAGRESLTPQAEIASRYIAAEFQKAGLKTQLQPFPLVAYRADPKQRQLVLTRSGSAIPLHQFTGGFYRDVDIKAPVVFAGYGITAPEYSYDDYSKLDAAGKIVLLFDHEPQEGDPASIFNGAGHTLHAGRAAKLLNARRHGAIAVLIATEPNHQAVPQPRAPLRANAPTQAIDDPEQIPAFTVAESVLAELLSVTHRTPAQIQDAIDHTLEPQSQALPDTMVEIRYGNLEQHRGTSLNAAGLLLVSDPALKSETILVTAHSDHLGVQNGHVYPGANDNASGTVAVMELARLFAAASKRPRRSILFLVFGSEEELMLGSFYYAAHPLRPLAGTRAVANLDMIARDEEPDAANRINLVGTYYSRGLLDLIRAQNRATGLELSTKLDADHSLNVLFRCDHLPFLLSGVPAVWFFGGFHPGYHEPSDVVDQLNFSKLQKVIRLAYDSIAALANTPTPPRFGVRR